jgi:hypothetical protein
MRRSKRSRGAALDVPAPLGPQGLHDDARRWIDVDVPLRGVSSAPDDGIEVDADARQAARLARRSHERSRASRKAQALVVAGCEVHRVGFVEGVPRELVGGVGAETRTHDGDRSLAGCVDVREGAALSCGTEDALDAQSHRHELVV